MRYDALAVADARGVQSVSLGPTSLLARPVPEGVEIIAVGAAAEVDRHPAAGAAERVSLPASVLLPGLVNAHTHLDLTHIGPQRHDGGAGFMGFVDLVRGGRVSDRKAIAESVERGVELSLAGGSAAVGDIAGVAGGGPSLAAVRALARGPLRGVSYLEFFAVGAGAEDRLRQTAAVIESGLAETRRGQIRLGLQPHAPYSVSLEGYRWALEQARRVGLPLCTHLAETPEEAQFMAQGTGPFRAFLERLGAWDGRMDVGVGRRPVEHLSGVLADGPVLAVHVNLASDADIGTLARTGTSVAYCPRASAYFGAERHFGPHRYREMLAAGVNVCMGTDSIINLPASAADPAAGGISVLDEMRFLWRRDATDAAVLLQMATVNGARALGLDPAPFTLAPGVVAAGLLAVDVGGTPGDRPALERVLASDEPVRWLVGAGVAPRRRGSRRAYDAR